MGNPKGLGRRDELPGVPEGHGRGQGTHVPREDEGRGQQGEAVWRTRWQRSVVWSYRDWAGGSSASGEPPSSNT
jgi:hypothetical protein